ncbi:MAG: hypothetical protein ACREXY_14230, partial [Gammaproteobacteria bacterium]
MKLEIELKNKRPVELVDFSLSMVALGAEYRRFSAEIADGESHLYIRGLRDGSIIAELIPAAIYVSSLLPEITQHAKKVLEFAKFLKDARDFLLGHGKKPDGMEKKSLQNISQFLEPVAKDGGSQINISAMHINGDIHMHYSVTSVEAGAIQNAVSRSLSLEKPSITGLHQGVGLYWTQAR